MHVLRNSLVTTRGPIYLWYQAIREPESVLSWASDSIKNPIQVVSVRYQIYLNIWSLKARKVTAARSLTNKDTARKVLCGCGAIAMAKTVFGLQGNQLFSNFQFSRQLTTIPYWVDRNVETMKMAFLSWARSYRSYDVLGWVHFGPIYLRVGNQWKTHGSYSMNKHIFDKEW